MTTSSCF